MIQFNLLPDVKIEFVKAQRTKRLVIGVALIITATSFILFLLLLAAVHGVQGKNLRDLNKDIEHYSKELNSTPDLNKILTVQNQLASLGGLHDDKVVASRLFNFIQQVTPAGVTISDHSTDFTQSMMTITGKAPGLDRVNTFTDTLKFATFTKGDQAGDKAFSNVVLSQFGRDDTGTTYTITVNYDSALFSSAEDVSLVVPKTSTTRSSVGAPSADIFDRSTAPNNSGSN